LHALEEDVEAPSWGELKELVARGHEVWSHGVNHVQLHASTPSDVLEYEIVASRAILEEKLETAVRGYCPPVGHSVPPGALALISGTYEMAFGGRPSRVQTGGDLVQIPRSNIEASWPSAAVDLQLSRLGDAMSRVLEGVRS
jgi:peptidoglycan/xylan/chitin deacetylase (PgdA/CDA1 family)